MDIAVGTKEYEIGASPVTGCGVSYSSSELDSALTGPVAKIVFDDSGKGTIQSYLEGLTETEFEKQGVERILEDSKPPENWRLGEALAESYLVYRRDCFFPWPDSRDERKAGSSLPGADLVGIIACGSEHYFAFGEVKTSSEEKYPPGSMHGRTGLKQQLEDLKNGVVIRDNLIKYLAFRASTLDWKPCFENAAKKYLQSNTNVRVFGVLVRDVKPHENDLKVRVSKLSQNAHSDMIIELLAIYLPENCISNLGENVWNGRNGGAG